jgi:hypothetical protein
MDLDEFLRKACDFAPTPLLILLKNGTECGGVAGVPRPTWGPVADPARGSLTFSRSPGGSPARFEPANPHRALHCAAGYVTFGCDSHGPLVMNGCDCNSEGQGDYAGPRDGGQLVGGTADACYRPYGHGELRRL